MTRRRRIASFALWMGGLLGLVSLSSALWWGLDGVEAARRYGPRVDLISALLWLTTAAVIHLGRLDERAAERAATLTYCASSATLAGLAVFGSHQTGQAGSPLTWAPVLIVAFPLFVPSPRPELRIAAAILAALGGTAVAIAAVQGDPRELLATLPALAAAGTVGAVGARRAWQSTVEVEALQEQERLLAAVLDGVGDGIALARDGIPVLANTQATKLLERYPELRDVLGTAGDHHLTLGSTELVATQRSATIGGTAHALWVLREVTETVDRAKLEAWRQLGRTLSHELGNSLAPIASLLHSARELVTRDPEKLRELLPSIRERVLHLAEFVTRYGAVLKLPDPRPERVDWGPFLARLQPIEPFTLSAQPVGPGWFDPVQLEQVVLNLVRNAREAGSETVEVHVGPTADGIELTVSDRGHGLTDEVLQRALVPMFTTRPRGTGLGLALVSEVIAAHDGRLALERRPGGGAVVRVGLPGPPEPSSDAIPRPHSG